MHCVRSERATFRQKSKHTLRNACEDFWSCKDLRSRLQGLVIFGMVDNLPCSRLIEFEIVINDKSFYSSRVKHCCCCIFRRNSFQCDRAVPGQAGGDATFDGRRPERALPRPAGRAEVDGPQLGVPRQAARR